MDLCTVCVDTRTADSGPAADNTADMQMTAPRTRRRSVRAVFGRLLQNGAVPKLIVLSVSLCLVYVLLRLSVDLLDIQRLSSLGVFSVYVDTVSALVNATNSDVVATAAAYNSVLMPSFSDLIHTQIINLHQLVNHFNHGLRRYLPLLDAASFVQYKTSNYEG